MPTPMKESPMNKVETDNQSSVQPDAQPVGQPVVQPDAQHDGQPVVQPVGQPDAQDDGQPGMRKNRKPVIAAIAGAIVLVLALAGLNLVGFISLPFLPKSPEIVLLRALNDIANDGTFGIVANADTDVELSAELLGQEAVSNIRLAATATGTARDFDADDPSKLKIPDGSFNADCTLALDAGLLEGETGNLHASGTFDLALAEGELNYYLKEPIQYEGTIQFDTSALLGSQKQMLKRSINLNDIEDMKMEGDTVTFTVNTSSIDTSVAIEMLKGILQPADIDVVDPKTNLSNLDVSVDLSTPELVRAHVTGQMDMTAIGRKKVALHSMLPSVPVDTNLKISVPIDIEFTLS